MTKKEVMNYIKENIPKAVYIDERIFHITVKDSLGGTLASFKAQDFDRENIDNLVWERND